ncbi:MAG: glycosyl transferase group 1 [Frankiales bacterium]|nr:glycosyl transferase group 1 [Frankiales bacterium]
MRVALVTESVLPQVNGVTNSVLRVCEQMHRLGHEVLVVAPGDGPTTWAGARVVRTPSVPLPVYGDFRLARPWPGLAATLGQFRPDVVHLASPAVLGAQAAFTARRLGFPVVAVYQTNLAGFASPYGLSSAERAIWRWLRRVHGAAGRTLAPSRHAVLDLQRNGVQRVDRWARGVDLGRFHPLHRDTQLRSRLAPGGELIVGYVGRLAQEKQVELLVSLRGQPRTKLVIVGDGPRRQHLQRRLPEATFLGFQSGDQLAETFASLDVFVHTGPHETFCQAAQEALASGVPVVGPRAGGLLDLVEPGVTGQLFVPASGASLREQVGLLADPGVRERMAVEARRSVEGRGWDVIGDQLQQHYREVVSL